MIEQAKDVFSYIKTEETNYKTIRIPITKSKDWNMYEHIERCKNVSNAWFHQGSNDGMRPYDDIVTPILNVAFRTEGFDVKDIVPFVDDAKNSYKSFIIKKRHPQWARKYELDTFIDDLVETSVIYDLALIKNINNVRPEVVDLSTIAFCDQTDVMAGPICLKHFYTVAELIEMKGKWIDDKIDQAILLSKKEKDVPLANDQVAKTPNNYIEVYELRGNLPEVWLNETGELFKYVPQMHIVCYYKDQDGNNNGITLFKGPDKSLSENFKALKIDRIRSKGRACGRSIVESLFEPQVWANYDAIKVKGLLDSAFNLIVTDSAELGNQKLNELKSNTILKQNKGDTTTVVTSNLNNIVPFSNHRNQMENSARVIGSASDAQLGNDPASGTPFALQALVVQQGQGIHAYRQGKIASFFADVLYRDWILKWLVDDINSGVKFSEELTLDEMMEISETIANNQAELKVKKLILEGNIVDETQRTEFVNFFKDEFMKGGNRKFFEMIKGELDEIPVDVFVNIKGKQRYMAQNADKITNILREVMRNPQAFAQIPGVGSVFNQLLEESGLSPINFSKIIEAPVQVKNKIAPVEEQPLKVA